jgi:hypothetical protein
MAGFIDELMKNYGPEVSKQLSSNLGINKNVAAELIPQVAPLIMGGLKKQMETRGGEDRANHILNKYGSESVLDNIGGLFASGAKEESPDPGLGGLLGNSGVQATDMLASKFNIDSNMAKKIIPMLAPVVLGALKSKRDKEGVGASGIAALIDQDGDGQVLDDVAGFLMGALSSSGSQKKGGLLGNLLGGFLGKK